MATYCLLQSECKKRSPLSKCKLQYSTINSSTGFSFFSSFYFLEYTTAFQLSGIILLSWLSTGQVRCPKPKFSCPGQGTTISFEPWSSGPSMKSIHQFFAARSHSVFLSDSSGVLIEYSTVGNSKRSQTLESYFSFGTLTGTPKGTFWGKTLTLTLKF